MAKNIYRNKTVAQLIKIAVRHFHLYIRNRDQGKPCISCGKKTKLQAGHFYSAGKHPQLRFNEDNVHGQCLSCNYYKSGDLLNYRINLIDNEFIISNPLSADQSGFETERRQNEMMVNIAITDELITLDGENTITVMGALTHQNPTIVLYKNRTYKFIVDSVGHGIEIVDGLGEDATRLEGFVSGQGTEIGNIMLRTDTDEIHGEIPDVIYYRSVNDPLKTGKILVKDITHVEHYSTEFKGVTAYNIDISYNTRDQLQRLGWGVDIPDGANAWQYYTIYEYLSAENTEQEYVSNIIKWNDDQDQVLDLEGTTEGVTTIDYDYVKKYSDWSRDGGVSDIVIEKTLREGLGLFDGIDAIDRNYD